MLVLATRRDVPVALDLGAIADRPQFAKHPFPVLQADYDLLGSSQHSQTTSQALTLKALCVLSRRPPAAA